MLLAPPRMCSGALRASCRWSGSAAPAATSSSGRLFRTLRHLWAASCSIGSRSSAAIRRITGPLTCGAFALQAIRAWTSLSPKIAEHLGELWQDAYASTCSWLSDVKDLPYAQASDLARTFTSADSAKTPQLILGGYYLGGAGPDSARGNLCRILSPTKTRLDRALWEKVFGSQHLLSLDHSGFWNAGCTLPAGPLDGGSFGSGTFFGSAAPSALSEFSMADA